jgi:hypothetical protein
MPAKPGNSGRFDRPHSYGPMTSQSRPLRRADAKRQDQSEQPQERQMPPEFEEEQEDAKRPKIG